MCRQDSRFLVGGDDRNIDRHSLLVRRSLTDNAEVVVVSTGMEEVMEHR